MVLRIMRRGEEFKKKTERKMSTFSIFFSPLLKIDVFRLLIEAVKVACAFMVNTSNVGPNDGRGEQKSHHN